MIFRPPFSYDPSDPSPDPQTVAQINPGDLAALRDAATKLVNAADAAAKTNAVLTVAPGIRSTLAAKAIAQVANTPILITPAVAGKIGG